MEDRKKGTPKRIWISIAGEEFFTQQWHLWHQWGCKKDRRHYGRTSWFINGSAGGFVRTGECVRVVLLHCGVKTPHISLFHFHLHNLFSLLSAEKPPHHHPTSKVWPTVPLLVDLVLSMATGGRYIQDFSPWFPSHYSMLLAWNKDTHTHTQMQENDGKVREGDHDYSSLLTTQGKTYIPQQLSAQQPSHDAMQRAGPPKHTQMQTLFHKHGDRWWSNDFQWHNGVTAHPWTTSLVPYLLV